MLDRRSGRRAGKQIEANAMHDDLKALCATEFADHIDELFGKYRIETYSDGPDWVKTPIVGRFTVPGMRLRRRRSRSWTGAHWRRGSGSRPMDRHGRNHCRCPGKLFAGWRRSAN